jgi:hypothetical protein
MEKQSRDVLNDLFNLIFFLIGSDSKSFINPIDLNKQKYYNFLIDIGRNDDSSFFHVLQVIETLFVLLHLEVVFDYYCKNVPSAYCLFDVRLKL